ncbi:hypothetical protein [Acrocarpospora catenulata]|uniref:hypothetical protein n=1 Tax=Acrocarpospora catenulata TaxID=2836182 RepID=UPI0027DFE3F9|nr:hypothetical protein [Acrocarpospora catenulata]
MEPTAYSEAVLKSGGTLEVVLPSRDYRQTKVKPDHAEQFNRLLSRAVHIRVMDFDHASREAYVAANEAMLGSVDELVAVWDGEPASGGGGTADVVAEARERELPVRVNWPKGAKRDPLGARFPQHPGFCFGTPARVVLGETRGKRPPMLGLGSLPVDDPPSWGRPIKL